MKTFRSTAATASAASATGAYISTFLLTLANPLTILSFTAAFAGMGAAVLGYSGVATMLAGVFAGSALWWLMLTGVAGSARGRLTPAVFVTINRVSGLILVGFGIYAGAGLLNH